MNKKERPSKKTEPDPTENEEVPSADNPFERAKYMEVNSRYDEATAIYEGLLLTDPHKALNYDRLMMIYRRKKDYKNELRILNTGIKVFGDFYMPSAAGKHRTIISLSKKLNQLIGLTDKRGRSLSEVEPIGKWKKRKEIVLKKMKSK